MTRRVDDSELTTALSQAGVSDSGTTAPSQGCVDHWNRTPPAPPGVA